MAVPNRNFKIHQGETPSLLTSVKNKDGTPKDLGGATIQWVLKKKENDNENVIYKDTEEGINIVDAAAGRVSVNLSEVETQALTPGIYWHGMRVTDRFGKSAIVFTGRVSVSYGKVKKYP